MNEAVLRVQLRGGQSAGKRSWRLLIEDFVEIAGSG
jgi:hypothetical protein